MLTGRSCAAIETVRPRIYSVTNASARMLSRRRELPFIRSEHGLTVLYLAGERPFVLDLSADIPVGGGVVYTAALVVVTQPFTGQYKGFSAICTHVGCICNQVANGTINCPCHGSKFSVTNGSVVAGPASSPLARVSIKVEGTSIVPA